MATYREIREYVRNQSGFQPKTCWIAHVKEMSGLKMRRAWNRQGRVRKVPCPSDKVEPIREALRQLGMIR